MAALHKILMVHVTEDMLIQMDALIQEKGGRKERAKLVSEALSYYLQEKNKQRTRESLAEGYQEMAEINLHICQEYFLCEQEVMK